MTYQTIYKAGVPATAGIKTAGSLNTNSVSVAASKYTDRTPTVSGVAGIATHTVPNPTQPAYGIKQAGSLNANGVLVVAPGRNSPQS